MSPGAGPARKTHHEQQGLARSNYRVGWGAPVVVGPPLIVGASANNASADGGAFSFNVNNAPANANWNNGCGLSLCTKKKSAIGTPSMLLPILTHW